MKKMTLKTVHLEEDLHKKIRERVIETGNTIQEETNLLLKKALEEE